MKKASQTTWLANINPNNQTAMCQVSIVRFLYLIILCILWIKQLSESI